jgi:hypothetical protein
MLRTVTAATAALALLASCAPETQSPVRVRALVLDANGKYVPQEVQLTTVTDIVNLEGSVARFVGGARIIVDESDPDLANAFNVGTEEAILRAMVKDEGGSVTASYIEQDGVLWPADFHTWNLVTTYYNLERANAYFRTVGGLVDADFGKGPTPVYYFPEFRLTSPDPLQDNALYFPPVKAFMVLPFEELQRAPLAINASVLTHEYSHLIFNQKVYGGQSLPPPITVWGASAPSPGANILKSLDEGLADYHAYGASCVSGSGCNPRVLNTSFEDASVLARDISQSRCMSATQYNQLYGLGLGQFSGIEYQVGTIVANALYAAAQSTAQQQAIQKAVLAAYSDSNPNSPGIAQRVNLTFGNQADFTLGLAVGAIARHIPDMTLRTAVCSQFVERLGIDQQELVQNGDCPENTLTAPRNCPKLTN